MYFPECWLYIICPNLILAFSVATVGILLHNIIKLYQSQNCTAQEIKFWSKYPSLCYITATKLRWEICRNFNSYVY